MCGWTWLTFYTSRWLHQVFFLQCLCGTLADPAKWARKKKVTNAFLLAGCCVGHTTSQTIIHCYAYRNTNHRVVQKNSCKLKKEMEETTQQDSSEAARLPLTCMGSWKQSAHVYTSRKNCLYGSSSSSSSNTPVDSQQNCWFTTGQRLAPIRYILSQNDVLSPLINRM